MPRWLLKHSLAGSPQAAAACGRDKWLSISCMAKHGPRGLTMVSHTLVENSPQGHMSVHCAETGVEEGDLWCAPYQGVCLDVPDMLWFGKAKHGKLNSPAQRLCALRLG